MVPKCDQKAAAVPNPALVRRRSAPSTVLAICAQGARRTESLGHGLPALRQTLAAWSTVTGTAVGAGQLHPITVVAKGLLDHPVGATACRQATTPTALGARATCNALACQNQTAVHHMGCRLWNRRTLRADRLQRNGRNGRNVGVKTQSIVAMIPGGAWANIHTGPTVAVAQFADGYSVLHGWSGARATMLSNRLCAYCSTQPKRNAAAGLTLWMRQKPVGSPPRGAVAPHRLPTQARVKVAKSA